MTTLARTSYGDLHIAADTTHEDRDTYQVARDLVALAAKAKKIPGAHDSLKRDRKGRWSGFALHHEIYDISGATVLVCVRETEGTRYGVKTLSKNYYMIRRCGRGVIVTEANKALAAKAAKSQPAALGYAIAVLSGRDTLAGHVQPKREGYKALTLDDAGRPISVWDASPWPLGKTRIERATDNHTGGFYYYRTIREVIEAAHDNNIFGDARDHKNLVVARVEVSGREIGFTNGATVKRCVTRIKPVEIVASII